MIIDHMHFHFPFISPLLKRGWTGGTIIPTSLPSVPTPLRPNFPHPHSKFFPPPVGLELAIDPPPQGEFCTQLL